MPSQYVGLLSLHYSGVQPSLCPAYVYRLEASRGSNVMPTAKKPKSKVNEAGNYTKPTMRKNLFEKIKAGSKGGKAGQWSARKAQMLAKEYKAKGGGYKS